jgi:hypothetical protein
MDSLPILCSLSCLVLHPRYKLKYFHEQKWQQAWIDTACELVEDEYNHVYKGLIVVRDSDSSLDSDAGNKTQFQSEVE